MKVVCSHNSIMFGFEFLDKACDNKLPRKNISVAKAEHRIESTSS